MISRHTQPIMKHFFFVWFVFMAALASFAADAPAAKTLEGSWVPVKAELGGQPVPEAILKTISPGEVTLEFFVKDTVVSVFKSGMKEIRIPRAEIDAVRLKRGWFGAKVHIRVKSLKWLAELPGCENGEVTLHIARRDRELAAAFVCRLPASAPLRAYPSSGTQSA